MLPVVGVLGKEVKSDEDEEDGTKKARRESRRYSWRWNERAPKVSSVFRDSSTKNHYSTVSGGTLSSKIPYQ